MRTSNHSDLESLYFDSQDGVADWNLPPHPRIWGQNLSALSIIFERCPDARRLERTLLASHLIWPESTPNWAIPWLTSLAPILTDRPLVVLKQASWRLASVPVAAGSQGRIHQFLIGAGYDLPIIASDEDALAHNSRQALLLVRNLIQSYSCHETCFVFLGPSRHGVVIEGESLALPCYLGALAAARNLELTSLLATGRLDRHGRVLPVDCLDQKLEVSASEVQLFIYPEGCVPPVSSKAECVAVSTIQEAADILICSQPGMNNKIVQADRTLGSGRGMAREICAFTSEMSFWLHRHRERISEVLRGDPHLEELISQLRRWTNSTLQVDVSLGNAVLACFTLEWVQEARLATRMAWDICTLQMDKANHSGDPVALREWADAADNLRPGIEQNGDCGRMLTICHVQKLIGAKHNRYDFPLSVEDDNIAEEIREMEQVHARQCSRRGPCSNAVLGQYYGTIGQHYGFLGPAFLDQTMNYLNRAIDCFHGDDNAARQEQDRDRLYQVFALSSADRRDKAEDILRNVDNLWLNKSWNINGMNPYQLHALLRLYTDAEISFDAGVWAEIHNTRLQKMTGHPSQLISYNLGLLAPDSTTATGILQRSAAQCRDAASGPTIQAMALLPLARLHSLEPDLNISDQVDAAMSPVRTGALSTDHFSHLLTITDWKTILKSVSTHRAQLFPFTYR